MDPGKLAALECAMLDLLDAPMVTRWLIVAEIVDADGERCLADVTSPGLACWDFTGMTTAAAQGRAAQPMWNYADEDD